jgi:phosphate starvation-inducible protein PhoH
VKTVAVKNTVQAVPLTNIDSSTLTTTYQPINVGGLPQPCSIIRLNSTSTTAVTISYDSVNDHEFLIAGGSTTLSFQNNSQPNNFITNMAQGTVVYAKGTAGTGNIYLSGYYSPKSTV